MSTDTKPRRLRRFLGLSTNDTLVTLRVDPTMRLEKRLELLAYAFAKACQGAVLKEIVSWEIKDGCVKFILGGGPAIPGPRGEFTATIENVPGVDASEEPVSNGNGNGKSL